MTINFPKYDARFVGTGDLFAALMLAWMHRTNNDLKTSIENTIATLQKVLARTMTYAAGNIFISNLPERNNDRRLIAKDLNEIVVLN